MKKMATTLMAAVFIIAFSASAWAKTYKIAVVPWAGWSPAHVAEVNGFWQKQPIAVKVITTANLQESIALFENGLVDMYFDLIGSAIGSYLEGQSIVIIAETDWSHGGDKIIIKKGIKPDALKTKPIGVFLNQPSVTYFLNRYLATIGLKLSDTRIVEMESSALTDHFINDTFGVIVNYDPEALRAERQGNGMIVATSATYEGSNPEGLIMKKSVFENTPQADLVKILKGWIQAVEWIKQPTNWNAYMDILNNHTFKNDPPYSEADLKDMVNSVRIHDAATLKQRNQSAGGINEYFVNFKAFLSENQLLKKDFTLNQLFDNKALMQALGD